MSDDPWSPQEGIVVTIKYGKGYDESWAVFRGDIEKLRDSIVGYFDLSADWASEVSLHELVLEATRVAHGTSTAVRTLGGKAVTPAEVKEDPWEKVAAEKAEGKDPKEEEEAERLLASIAGISDVDALKRLWAENQDAFKDDKLMAAWKARGKELSK